MPQMLYGILINILSIEAGRVLCFFFFLVLNDVFERTWKYQHFMFLKSLFTILLYVYRRMHFIMYFLFLNKLYLIIILWVI